MSTRVNVATTKLNEPIPGVMVTTSYGDVILVVDRALGLFGLHAPDDMLVDDAYAIINMLAEEAHESGVDLFARDDTAPLVFEDDFMWRNTNG